MELLKDKVALITGGTRGIGYATAKVFLENGAKVIVCARHQPRHLNTNIEYMHLDVADSNECKEVADSVIKKYGRVDVLVAGAGITMDCMTHKMTDDAFEQVIDVNLKGVFNIGRFIGPQMQSQGYGSIITIASIVAEFGNIGQANYAASKGGVISLSKSWAKEFSRKGSQVRVNAISPGYILTDMLKTVPKDLLGEFESSTMLNRLGKPVEVANAALFLASDLSSYVTGSVLAVNGGMRL